jgi:predicted Zn-dependent peptidase
MSIRTVAAVAMLALVGCGRAGDRPAAAIDFERYELANGLDVILHVDRSDPIATVTMTFHVGSARELPGKTGFAHLFEHLFFLDSENLAGAFETGDAKLGILADMSAYGFPADYVLQREQIVRDMTVERIRELADRYLGVERMAWLVVGDAETQLGRLGALGLGEPVLLDREGRPSLR